MREDYPQWLPLWDGYNAFYGRAGATALPDAVTQATWGRFFDIYEPMHALVAEEGKALLGLVHYLFHRNCLYGVFGVKPFSSDGCDGELGAFHCQGVLANRITACRHGLVSVT